MRQKAELHWSQPGRFLLTRRFGLELDWESFSISCIRLLTVKQTLPISDPDLIDCLGWGLKVMFYKKCFLFVEFLILVLHKFPSFLITVSILAQSLHIVQCVRSYCPGAAMGTFIDPTYMLLHFCTTRRTTLCILYFWWWLDLFVRSNCICVGSDRPSGGRNIFEVWTLNCNIV